MAMMRFEPGNAMTQLQNEINRIFGNMHDAESSGATSEWMPAVDIAEYTDRFELLIDLPGVDPKAVDITLDKGMLTISGERQNSKPLQGRNDHTPQRQRSERHVGRFHRQFILPDTVDTESVSATGRDGVLEIAIAKHPKSQPRRISVKS